MFVYIKSEPNLWTVGHYDPKTGAWIPQSDHHMEDDAKHTVRHLNGGEEIIEELHILFNERLPSRRERIATACLAGLLADPEVDGKNDALAKCALGFADALIAMLNRPTKADMPTLHGSEDGDSNTDAACPQCGLDRPMAKAGDASTVTFTSAPPKACPECHGDATEDNPCNVCMRGFPF